MDTQFRVATVKQQIAGQEKYQNIHLSCTPNHLSGLQDEWIFCSLDSLIMLSTNGLIQRLSYLVSIISPLCLHQDSIVVEASSILGSQEQDIDRPVGITGYCVCVASLCSYSIDQYLWKLASQCLTQRANVRCLSII